MPVGAVDFASDLEYRDPVLYATDVDGLPRFRACCKELGREAYARNRGKPSSSVA
jgi:hypothetical protein